MLRATPPRISRAELRDRVATAPRFQEARLPEDELDRMCAGYEAITGVRITTPKKRAFVAAASRTLGSAFLAAVKDRFAETGTETNLLADLRSGRAANPRSVDGELSSAPSAADRQERETLRRAPRPPDPWKRQPELLHHVDCVQHRS